MDMYIGTDEYENENALHKVDTLIEVLTDNKNRTLPVVRHILDENGGSLAEKG